MRVLPRVWDAEEAAEGEPLVPALRMHAAALGILSATHWRWILFVRVLRTSSEGTESLNNLSRAAQLSGKAKIQPGSRTLEAESLNLFGWG